ncbi:hypothetical protein QQS21_004294 [Conoideocrella luteorostrata]|uniref:Survival protein SurE-like phosphatase/nucleotidase domain-containing protein n=1 Tax=Conoideocrella luteorostrata TaxID=1105319 RepID=A0AAJ0CSL8_9HYPO|nr:hypothetical protein QQS21_004294 [Conoideocrella luteorostrata]
MHILVTNDDGPPSSHSSPYIHCLVKHLEDAGHIVSVCLPHTQRSWIGKAHMIGQTLRPLYFTPSANIHGDDTEGITHNLPSSSDDAVEWVLIDGTPASCVQIGLYHFFQDKGPIDLVVSGPNYGRNTTSVFALSSGTLGAALEAAVCRRKSIALSFAFFSRNHDPVIIEAACRHGVRVIEALYKQWPTDESTDLYSVNVPLVEGVESNKTLWADMLQNYWREGSCFQEIEGHAGDPDEEEERIREGEVDNEANTGPAKGHKHKHFKWTPRLTDVYKSVELSGPGNDGRIVREGNTCITPLKANFAVAHADRAGKEFELPTRSESVVVPSSKALPMRENASSQGAQAAKPIFQAIVAYEDSYVQPLIVSALNSVFPPEVVKLVIELPSSRTTSSVADMSSSSAFRVLQITPYESIDFEFAAANPKSCLINSYMIRKALIRKHYLSATVDHWVAKNPNSPLKKHVQRSESFEVDYAEFLDDALVEAFDLRESMNRNVEAAESEPSKKEWWILKPGMSDRGQGIRLFSTTEELQDIFDGWEADRPDSDDECEDVQDVPINSSEGDRDYITTSHLRHFVAQPYIHPPLLLSDNRKFHIRTYVLCAGSLNVYVYKHMLALFAAKPYTAPWESPGDIESFLTNTCLQDSPNENSVRRFWNLPLPKDQLCGVFEQICTVTGEIFEAAARAMPIHFQTLPNAFEVFGLDFMVDESGVAWLLEVNAFPDFKQTGGDLKEIVQGFWEGVMRIGVAEFFGVEVAKMEGKDGDMVPVREVDLGRR